VDVAPASSSLLSSFLFFHVSRGRLRTSTKASPGVLFFFFFYRPLSGVGSAQTDAKRRDELSSWIASFSFIFPLFNFEWISPGCFFFFFHYSRCTRAVGGLFFLPSRPPPRAFLQEGPYLKVWKKLTSLEISFPSLNFSALSPYLLEFQGLSHYRGFPCVKFF